MKKTNNGAFILLTLTFILAAVSLIYSVAHTHKEFTMDNSPVTEAKERYITQQDIQPIINDIYDIKHDVVCFKSHEEEKFNVIVKTTIDCCRECIQNSSKSVINDEVIVDTIENGEDVRYHYPTNIYCKEVVLDCFNECNNGIKKPYLEFYNETVCDVYVYEAK